MPPKTLVSDFIVIGGGLTGLTHAYALARSGHRVTVLEKGDFDNVRSTSCFHLSIWLNFCTVKRWRCMPNDTQHVKGFFPMGSRR